MARMGRPPKVRTGELPAPLEFHWTVRQIATAHSMTVRAVCQAIENEELTARKFGKEYRITDAAYRDWLRRSEVRKVKAEEGVRREH